METLSRIPMETLSRIPSNIRLIKPIYEDTQHVDHLFNGIIVKIPYFMSEGQGVISVFNREKFDYDRHIENPHCIGLIECDVPPHADGSIKLFQSGEYLVKNLNIKSFTPIEDLTIFSTFSAEINNNRHKATLFRRVCKEKCKEKKWSLAKKILKIIDYQNTDIKEIISSIMEEIFVHDAINTYIYLDNQTNIPYFSAHMIRRMFSLGSINIIQYVCAKKNEDGTTLVSTLRSDPHWISYMYRNAPVSILYWLTNTQVYDLDTIKEQLVHMNIRDLTCSSFIWLIDVVHKSDETYLPNTFQKDAINMAPGLNVFSALLCEIMSQNSWRKSHVDKLLSVYKFTSVDISCVLCCIIRMFGLGKNCHIIKKIRYLESKGIDISRSIELCSILMLICSSTEKTMQELKALYPKHVPECVERAVCKNDGITLHDWLDMIPIDLRNLIQTSSIAMPLLTVLSDKKWPYDTEHIKLKSWLQTQYSSKYGPIVSAMLLDGLIKTDDLKIN